MPRFVITGGLGVGKTSVLSLLEPRYHVVAEPARELIAEHRRVGSEVPLDHQPERFIELLISRSIDNYNSASPAVVSVFDRGVPDCIAYAMAYERDIGPALEAAARYRYTSICSATWAWGVPAAIRSIMIRRQVGVRRALRCDIEPPRFV